MNEKLNKIKDILLYSGQIKLSKQCTQEYIVYQFKKINDEIVEVTKNHYSDSTMENLKKSKSAKIYKPSIDLLVDDDIYALLIKKYDILE